MTDLEFMQQMPLKGYMTELYQNDALVISGHVEWHTKNGRFQPSDSISMNSVVLSDEKFDLVFFNGKRRIPIQKLYKCPAETYPHFHFNLVNES